MQWLKRRTQRRHRNNYQDELDEEIVTSTTDWRRDYVSKESCYINECFGEMADHDVDEDYESIDDFPQQQPPPQQKPTGRLARFRANCRRVWTRFVNRLRKRKKNVDGKQAATSYALDAERCMAAAGYSMSLTSISTVQETNILLPSEMMCSDGSMKVTNLDADSLYDSDTDSIAIRLEQATLSLDIDSVHRPDGDGCSLVTEATPAPVITVMYTPEDERNKCLSSAAAVITPTVQYPLEKPTSMQKRARLHHRFTIDM